MAIKVSSLGQTVLVKKVGTSTNTFVKKVVVGAPTGRFISSSTVSLDGLTDVVAVNPDNGQFIAYDSDTDAYQLYSFADSTPRQAIRSLFSASGDLTYDSATGQFSFDVEQVYTKSNFDSDFNMSIDEAALGGVGLTYDSATNTLSIDSSEFNSYFLNRISTNLVPISDSTYDLGDSTSKWRSLYLSGNTIYLGNITLEDSNGRFVTKDEEGSILPSDLSQNNTNDLAEGVSNLYYTTARFDSDLQSTQSAGAIRGYFSATGDLTYNQSTGQFSIDVEQKYTKANFDSDLDLALSTDAVTTTDLTEGSNLYYTTTRANSAIDARVTKSFVDALNVDADTLDGVSSESFLRSDVEDTKTAGNLNFDNNVRLIFDNNLTVYRAAGLSTIAVTNSGVNGGYLLTDGKWQMRKSAHDGDIIGVFDGDGAVELYYDAAKKFETTSTGVTVTGQVTGNSATFANITRSGATSYSGSWGSATEIPVVTVDASGFIDSIGTTTVAGVTSISYDSATGVFTINTADGGSFVTTFHDSDDRIAEIRGALSAGGDLSYNPSTGEFTFDVESVYTKANFDSDLSLALSTDAVTTTDLTEGDNLYYTTSRHDSDTLAQVDSNYVQLRQDFAYASLTGAPTNVSSFTNDANYLDSVTVLNVIDSAYIKTVDYLNNEVLSFGNANDLQIYNNGTNSYIAEGGIGDLVIQGANIRFETPSSEYYIRTYNNGKVALYHDNSVKFETSSTGITVTGSVNADSATFTGAVTGDSFSVGEVTFRTDFHDSHIPFEEGALWYDPHHKNLNYYTDFDHPIEIGLQIVERVYNDNAYTINKGQPLYYSGNRTDEVGQESPTVALANATSATKYNVQGLAAEDIPPSSYGQIVVAGVIDGFDTSGLNAGENFFAGLTDGAVQNAPPSYPNYPMCLGWVIKSDATDGKVIINQQNHSVNSFRVQGDTHISANLVIDGNLTVAGTQTITSTENVQIGGNIQYLNAGNTIGEAGTTFVGSGLDDAFFAGHYNGDSSTKNFYVKIDSAGPTDTFEWGFDSTVGPVATGIAITGAEQTLTAGISIDFGATTGHSDGDKWTGTAIALNTDTGIFSNKNEGDAGNGYTHVGMYWDATENEWTFVGQYDSEPEAPINRSSPTFQYGDVRGKDFYGTTFNGALSGNATTATRLQTARDFSLTGDVTATAVSFDGTGNVALNTAITAGSIVNADINASAAIADTKLATISTSGKVQNSATTATSSNTASAIVARDASGNFSAGTITATFSGNLTGNVTGNLTGNADTATAADSAYHALSADSATTAASALFATNATNATSATQLATGRDFSLTGDVTATAVSFDGTGNVQLTTAYNPGSIVNADINASAAIADTKLATISTAGKVDNSATTATHNNTASAIVARNASGNFSAGTITASFTGDLTGNASTADSATNATTAINATNATNVAVTEETSSSDATHRFVFIGPSAFDPYESIKHSNAITLQPSTSEVYIQKLEITTSLRLAQDGGVTNDYLAFGTGQDARFYGGGSSDFVLDLRSDASRFVIGAGSGGSTVEKVAISVDSGGDVSTTTVTLNDSASAPSTTTNRLYSVSGSLYYNGTEVGTGGGDGGGASVTTSINPPVSPSDGDLWFDETSTSLFLYYQDSDTSQWVQVGGGGGGGGLSNAVDSGTGVTVSGDLTVEGNIFADSDVTASNFNTTSDARIKTNVRTIYDALDKTMQLRGVYFDKNGKPDIGLIAQEVEEVMPMVVNTLSDEMQTKTVNYSGLVGLLVQAIKSQQEQINDLTAKVNRLME